MPGARASRPARLVGRPAARAPLGRVIDRREVEADGQPRSVALVAVDRVVAVDLFADRGGSRGSRSPMPTSADGVSGSASSRPDVTVIWRNPDGTVVTQAYRISAARLTV